MIAFTHIILSFIGIFFLLLFLAVGMLNVREILQVFKLLRKARAPFWQSMSASGGFDGSDAKVLCNIEDLPAVENHFISMKKRLKLAILLFVLFMSCNITVMLTKQ